MSSATRCQHRDASSRNVIKILRETRNVTLALAGILLYSRATARSNNSASKIIKGAAALHFRREKYNRGVRVFLLFLAAVGLIHSSNPERVEERALSAPCT